MPAVRITRPKVADSSGINRALHGQEVKSPVRRTTNVGVAQGRRQLAQYASPKGSVVATQARPPPDALYLEPQGFQLVGLETGTVLLPRLALGRRLRDEARRSHHDDCSWADTLHLAHDLESVRLVEVLHDVEGRDEVERAGASREAAVGGLHDGPAATAALRVSKRGKVYVAARRSREHLAPPSIGAADVEDRVARPHQVGEHAITPEEPVVGASARRREGSRHRPRPPTTLRTVRPRIRASRLKLWWRR